MLKPRILVVLTSNGSMGESGGPTGLWLEELTTPYYVFAGGGAEVTLASIRGGPVPVDPRSVEDSEQPPTSVARFHADGRAGGSLDNSAPLAQFEARNFEAIFLPGGHGTMWDLPDDPRLAALLSDAWRLGKVIGAVCHGPAGLVGAKDETGKPLVAGRRVTAFSNAGEKAVGLDKAVPFLLETRLAGLDARYEAAAEPFAPHAITDGRLITGQNPASAGPAAQLVLEALKSSA